MKVLSKIFSEDDEIVIQHISNCINDKMSLLNIKLTDLAKQANIDYFTLRKIVNQEDGYLPNLRILVKLAKYLNIKVGDLLNYNDLPQYIPIIEKDNITAFLNDTNKHFGIINTIFNEKYIHEKVFALKELNKELLIPANIIYICYPYQSKFPIEGKLYLFKIENSQKNDFIFGRINKINLYELEIDVGEKLLKLKTEQYDIIAIVINMKMSESLI